MGQELTHFHRIQVGKAQIFIRNNLDSQITLQDIAEASGASKYHFIRVFSAYVGETPFEYIQRQKILKAFLLLQNQSDSITDISLEVGFESQSSFNKAFKKIALLSPTDFRNLGKEEQKKVQYTVNINEKQKEIFMNLNLTEKPEIISRPETVIYTLREEGGHFPEIAPIAWQKFLGILGQEKQDVSQSEFLGISYIEETNLNEQHIYKVALSAPPNKNLSFKSLRKEVLPAAKYLKFTLKGSYQGVWPSFDRIYKFINESEFELANGPCLENYINDPNTTPEKDLLTELLVPVK